MGPTAARREAMDRGTRTAGESLTVAELEMLDRAATEVDLPGILRAYGWKAVHGEDAQNRRVLTDSMESRQIVVTRDPASHRWQWWDAAVRVIGNIVDAVRELLGFESLRDVLILLRRALETPPGPLPVQKTKDLEAASESEIVTPFIEPQHRSTATPPDEIASTPQANQWTAINPPVEPVTDDPEPASDDTYLSTGAAAETENSTDVESAKSVDLPPPKRRGRRR